MDITNETKKIAELEQQLIQQQKEIKKLTEEKNHLSDELDGLKNLINVIPASVYWKDKNGKYLGCNQYCADVFKLTPREIVGKTVFDFFPEHAFHITHQIDENIMSSNKMAVLEEKGLNAKGQPAVYL